MAVRGVLRSGFAQVRVMDLEESILHYRDRVGLEMVGEVENGRAYFRAFDEFDRHSLILREADAPGVDLIGFKVADAADLDAFKQRLEKMGVSTEEIPAGVDPSVGRRVRFTTPTKHVIDLYAEMDLSDGAPFTKNPDIWRREPRGMRVMRYDHCLLNGVDIAGTAKIFVEALDFDIPEEVVDEETGARLAIFLTCSNRAHDIALVGFPEDGKLHHVSFRVESWHDVGHAADLITRHDISRDIGPTRHGITRGQTIYFFDPSGNRNEAFAGGYDYYPDNPRRVWSADQAGKGIFYYEREVTERFMAVNT